jgi:4-hydroxybenzoate polyprenyltransferase
MKNKTLALWLTLLLGPLGLHRVYLFGRFDQWSFAFLVPTLLGAYGVIRARTLSLDDGWSWVLIPLLGFTLAWCALLAIVYGLQDTEKWNHRFNPGKPADDPAGDSNWLTVAGLAIALFAGTTVLLASIAFTFQHYFEFELDPSQVLDTPTLKKPAN